MLGLTSECRVEEAENLAQSRERPSAGSLIDVQNRTSEMFLLNRSETPVYQHCRYELVTSSLLAPLGLYEISSC